MAILTARIVEAQCSSGRLEMLLTCGNSHAVVL